jgi:hypothetical protein
LASKISGSLGGQEIVLQWEAGHQDWQDFAIYAPAIPGVVVALLGLWISHRLTIAREQRKQLLDFCEQLKDQIDAAVHACTEAWLSDKGLERQRKVKDSKRLLQRAGTSATTIKKRTSNRLVFRSSRTVDFLQEISELRRVATRDPFEDPFRAADGSHIDDINTAATAIYNKIDDSALYL